MICSLLIYHVMPCNVQADFRTYNLSWLISLIGNSVLNAKHFCTSFAVNLHVIGPDLLPHMLTTSAGDSRFKSMHIWFSRANLSRKVHCVLEDRYVVIALKSLSSLNAPNYEILRWQVSEAIVIRLRVHGFENAIFHGQASTRTWLNLWLANRCRSHSLTRKSTM